MLNVFRVNFFRKNNEMEVEPNEPTKADPLSKRSSKKAKKKAKNQERKKIFKELKRKEKKLKQS